MNACFFFFSSFSSLLHPVKQQEKKERNSDMCRPRSIGCDQCFFTMAGPSWEDLDYHDDTWRPEHIEDLVALANKHRMPVNFSRPSAFNWFLEEYAGAAFEPSVVDDTAEPSWVLSAWFLPDDPRKLLLASLEAAFGEYYFKRRVHAPDRKTRDSMTLRAWMEGFYRVKAPIVLPDASKSITKPLLFGAIPSRTNFVLSRLSDGHDYFFKVRPFVKDTTELKAILAPSQPRTKSTGMRASLERRFHVEVYRDAQIGLYWRDMLIKRRAGVLTPPHFAAVVEVAFLPAFVTPKEGDERFTLDPTHPEWVTAVVSLKAHKTLSEWILEGNVGKDPILFRALLAQTTATIVHAFATQGFVHGDLHWKNIMYDRAEYAYVGKNWYYGQGGPTIVRLPLTSHKNHMIKLIDFGRSYTCRNLLDPDEWTFAEERIKSHSAINDSLVDLRRALGASWQPDEQEIHKSFKSTIPLDLFDQLNAQIKLLLPEKGRRTLKEAVESMFTWYTWPIFKGIVESEFLFGNNLGEDNLLFSNWTWGEKIMLPESPRGDERPDDPEEHQPSLPGSPRLDPRGSSSGERKTKDYHTPSKRHPLVLHLSPSPKEASERKASRSRKEEEDHPLPPPEPHSPPRSPIPLPRPLPPSSPDDDDYNPWAIDDDDTFVWRGNSPNRRPPIQPNDLSNKKKNRKKRARGSKDNDHNARDEKRQRTHQCVTCGQMATLHEPAQPSNVFCSRVCQALFHGRLQLAPVPVGLFPRMDK